MTYRPVSRWLAPTSVTFYPAPPEAGRYDCADELPYTVPADSPVACAMQVWVTEGGAMVHQNWVTLDFVRLDLTATTKSAVTTTRPTGVRLAGEVTCTGLVGETYPVRIEGTVTQTSGGRRPTTVTGTFVTTVQCSGTAQPWRFDWSATVAGAFKAAQATVTLDVSAPGFTQHGLPLHVIQTITVKAPPKGIK